MKYPKLKHPWLCQNLLYAPVYLFFLIPVVFLILTAFGVEVPGPVFLIVFLGYSVFVLWYLYRNFLLYFGLDALFSEIHTWQRDRLEFSTGVNGSSRETAERRILRRCRLWGRRWEGSDERFTVYYRHAYSWTVYHSMIEKRIVLCRTERLTGEQYQMFLGQAMNRLRSLPDGKVRFRSKQEKKAPRAYVSMVVILADAVDETVKAKARELPLNTEEACVLPCVAECSTGHYYMNGGKTAYQAGMMPRPAQNYARGMARRLVFAFGLPKKNPEKRPPFENRELLEMSLWEYIRELKEGIREEKTGEDKERVKMLRRMKNGEVCLGEYAIYCKLQNRLAEWAFLPDETDEKLLSLLPGDTWYYQKESLKGVPGFRNEYSKRKMKPGQVQEVDRRVRAWLAENGYRIEP